MAVKDLVKRYESQAKAASSPSPSSSSAEGSPPRRRTLTTFGGDAQVKDGRPGPNVHSMPGDLPENGLGDEEPLELDILRPPPRARFMMHPLLKQALLPSSSPLPSDEAEHTTTTGASSLNDRNLSAIHETMSSLTTPIPTPTSLSTLTNPHDNDNDDDNDNENDDDHNDHDTHSRFINSNSRILFDNSDINDADADMNADEDEKTRLFVMKHDDFESSSMTTLRTLRTGGTGGGGGSGSDSDGKGEKDMKESITLPSASSSTLLPSASDFPSSMVPSKGSKYTRVSPRYSSSHISTPATSVFARNAAPLSLPSLDHYLSSIAAPTFSSFPYPHPDKDEKGADGGTSSPSNDSGNSTLPMFPPMDRLAATGKSIKDLETNSTIAPPWRNPNSILGGAVGAVLGAAGSSVVASFYSLQGILDTVQIFALILSTIVPHAGKNLGNKWKELFLGTIPNILAMNFASTLIQSLIFLTLFMAIAGLLLYYFFVATNECQPTNASEGFQPSAGSRRGWDVVVVSFILTVLYLPLSTIAVHALVWSDDFWAVPNPYVNATTFPPVLPPLGPSDQYRDPLDFCYTTTMKRNEANLAPIFVIISAATVIFFTVWFPLRLRRVVKQTIPIVDKYTELGQLRSNSDLDREYQRLLDRDSNHLNFLYKDFRRGWATYKSFYLFAKLSALLIIAIISPDNCLFRSLTRNYVAIVRQSVLLAAMMGFFILQCILAPFVDPTDNASEWTSRLNYVLTALVGLLVALNIPGQSLLNGVILYIVYIVTYGLSGYFTIISFSWMHRVVKRLTHRIDFSIDIFSPRLDISSSSPHVRRRIWQESISTIFLTSPECHIPQDQKMQYTQALDGSYPPYLLAFQGTPAERHVENLKILREVGSVAYAKAITTVSGGATSRFSHIQDQIQMHFVGPDCYWRPNETSKKPGSSSSHFGNAWWIPFPPTLVLQYDDSNGPLVVLSELHDLDRYLHQNLSEEVKRKREIRMALRALDGCIVSWPYDYEQNVGSTLNPFSCFGRQYKAKTVIPFKSCVFEIKRRGDLPFKGHQLASGFEVQLTYAKFAQVGGDVIGLNDHCTLNAILARFLSLNKHTIHHNLHRVQRVLQDYRDTLRLECIRKTDVLSYHFLSCVYNQPQEFSILAEGALNHEKDLRVRDLMLGNEIALDATYERFLVVTGSDVKTWWYIFWDDLWRRNYDTINALNLHAQDFNPHYPTSIAYNPLPRAALEDFLRQRGLMSTPSLSTDFFYSGFLNKIYFRLNELVFRGLGDAIPFHLGNGPWEIDLEDVDLATQARPSTLGTGGGTDHDDDSIRARPNYRWEGILDDPLTKGRQRQRGWSAKLGVWFGITPLWRTGVPSKGLALDVKLQNGKYVLLDQADSDT